VNIYVGNLSFDTSEDDLRDAFASFGQVTSAAIIKDKFSGQSRGFGFVEMSNNAEAQAAIKGLNGTELHERTLNVNEARPRTEGGNRSGGGYNRGGGGDRYNRGGNDRRRNY
jgi:RNA recognition motif-containing protein